MTETLEYTVLETTDGMELREYAPYLIAEIDVDAADYSSAAQRGFRPLAEFIFGSNGASDRIAMTSPVTAEPSGQQIAMTSPVTSSVGEDGSFTVGFSMPSKWTMDTIPKPNNPRVRLRSIERQRVLVTKFRGRNDRRRVDEGGRALVAHARQHGLVADGDPIWAGYSSPAVPLPLRRWEMLLRLES